MFGDGSITKHAVPTVDLEMHPTSSKLSLQTGDVDARTRMTRRVLAVAVAAVIIVLGSLFVLHSSWAVRRDSLKDVSDTLSRPDADESSTLGILLHPEDHVHRPPKIIHLEWRVSAGYRRPDGVRKRVYLVNDSFPGPTIEARPGDELVIDVYNGLSDDGVAIHWHGLPVPNPMDGAVGFTQCAIPPGRHFTYRFRIPDDAAGTYWWHAHSQSQRGDGLFGGLIAHEARDQEQDVSYERDVLLLVGDWFHRSADEVLAWYASLHGAGNEPAPDSVLVNGRGRFDCVAARVNCSSQRNNDDDGLPPLVSTPPVASRLRIVNVGAVAGFSVRVSGAIMQLLTVDGGFAVEPTPHVDTLGVIYPGERADAVVSWEKDVSRSRLHLSLDRENLNYPNPYLDPNPSFPVLGPSSDGDPSEESKVQNQPSLDIMTTRASLNSTETAPSHAQHTIVVYAKTQKLAHKGNIPVGFVNHTTWAPQNPPLASLPHSAWDSNQLVPYIPLPSDDSDSAWVDLVINNLDDGAHPFHLHGRPFYVVSRYRAGRGGWGSWKEGASVELESPLRKDTVAVPRRGHVVLRFQANLEGIWMLHCHVLAHLGSGMAMGLHVGSDEAHVVDEDADTLCKMQR